MQAGQGREKSNVRRQCQFVRRLVACISRWESLTLGSPTNQLLLRPPPNPLVPFNTVDAVLVRDSGVAGLVSALTNECGLDAHIDSHGIKPSIVGSTQRVREQLEPPRKCWCGRTTRSLAIP